MRKWFLVLMLLTVLSPVWGMFCQYCGKTMADDARFCPQCGKGVTIVIAPSGLPGKSAAAAPLAPAAVVNDASEVEKLNEYEPVNRYEMLLTSSSTLPSSVKVAERRYLAAQMLAKKEQSLATLSPFMAKGHALMVRKQEILDQYYDAWKTSLNGPMKAQGLARKEKLTYSLTKTNEMILALKTQAGDQSLLTRLDKQEQDLNEAVREYQVTSSYLRVDNGKLSKGQSFWLAETKNGWSRVVGMDGPSGVVPLTGWVSLYELSQRTSWKGEVPVVTYQAPVNPVLVYPPVQYEQPVVIIGHDGCWPWSWSSHRHHRDYDWRYGGHRRRH